MRLPTWWGLGMGLLCQALPSPCLHGATLTTAADLWRRVEPLLEPAASAPPEDPLASDCRYVRFQVEWVASKRDAGLPLGEVLPAAWRVFLLDRPWPYALYGALGTLVYRAPQRSPAALRQAIEAACLAPLLLGAEHRAAW
jgi:hypothetical protein